MIPLLFSYGTLQQENVQLGTFQRRLSGQPDALVGYAQSTVAIDDPDVVKTSVKTHHPIDRHTGAAYVRVLAPLASGDTAWVYVDRRYAPVA